MEIAWNFTRSPLDGDGNVVARYSSMVALEKIAAQLQGMAGTQYAIVGGHIVYQG